MFISLCENSGLASLSLFLESTRTTMIVNKSFTGKIVIVVMGMPPLGLGAGHNSERIRTFYQPTIDFTLHVSQL